MECQKLYVDRYNSKYQLFIYSDRERHHVGSYNTWLQVQCYATRNKLSIVKIYSTAPKHTETICNAFDESENLHFDALNDEEFMY